MHHLAEKTKHVLLWYALALVVGVGVVWALNFWIAHRSFADTIGGQVVAVKDGKITVQGYLVGIPNDERKLVTIEFTPSADVAVTKTSILINATKHTDGKPFMPETKESAGTLNEIKQKTRVSLIKSPGNLVGKKSATAVEIHYQVTVF